MSTSLPKAGCTIEHQVLIPCMTWVAESAIEYFHIEARRQHTRRATPHDLHEKVRLLGGIQGGPKVVIRPYRDAVCACLRNVRGVEGVGERGAFGCFDVGKGDTRGLHLLPVNRPIVVRYIYAFRWWCLNSLWLLCLRINGRHFVGIPSLFPVG